jgi:hypothetical protein
MMVDLGDIRKPPNLAGSTREELAATQKGCRQPLVN